VRINEISLENFRPFKKEAFAFPDQVTVLVGDNGTGKSALLEALGVAAGAALLELDSEAARSIDPADVRLERFDFHGVPTAEAQVPCVVRCNGAIGDRQIMWQRSLRKVGGRTDRGGARELRTYMAELAADVRGGEPRSLPLVAYYSTARLWLQKRDRPHRATEWRGPASRFDGYVDALESASSQKLFLAWMRSRAAEGIKAGAEPQDLRAVRRALGRALAGGWNDVDYDLLADELVALRRTDSVIDDRLPFQLLSDGQRTMLALVADLAYRCATLNPHLTDPCGETAGVVLIDEIDLHLHPLWQRRVIDDLVAAFPRLQLVTTTHSAFVVQSRGPHQLIDLNRDEVSMPGGEPNEPDSADFRVLGLEDVAQQALDVPDPGWSAARQEMWRTAEEFYATLRRARSASDPEVQLLKQRLDELGARFSDNPAYHAFLAAERATSGIDEGA
jgi:predicted ATP-binding protein involved in virulence